MERISVVIMVLVFSVVAVAAMTDAESGSSSSTAELNGTHLNATDYWAEDHQYNNQSHWKRLPNGKVVPNNDSSFNSFADYRGEVEAKTPWISKWVLSTEGRRTLKKDIPRLLMYNLVSPMDYGSSARSSNVRRRRNKAIGMFLTENLALPLLKSLGHVAWNLIESHYGGYFEDEIFAQRLKMMNASEMIHEFNLTLPMDAIVAAEDEESRPNTTMAYIQDGESRRAVLYKRYSVAFAPYEDYSDKYYTRDDGFQQPTFPADSYPWLWSPRLNVARMLASELLRSLAVDNEKIIMTDSNSIGHGDDVELDSCSSSCVESEAGEFPRELADLPDNSSSISNNLSTSEYDSTHSGEINGSIHKDNIAMKANDIQALEQIQVQLQEFFFDTGIPRFTMRSNGSHLAFPSLEEYLQTAEQNNAGTNLSAPSNSSASGSLGSSNEAGITATSYLKNARNYDGIGNVTDYFTRRGVYAALTHFYAYPSVLSDSFTEENALVVDCTVEKPCLVQSGVTVYTPSLTTLTVFQTFAESNVTPATKRVVRLAALLEMVQVAFEAEWRALNHGLQSPSTVWYSNHDLDVDEFADAVLGTVIMSISGDTGDSTPLHVFEKHMNEPVPILDEVVSYYADTNHDTKVLMELNHSIPMLDKFEESGLVELVSTLESQMKNLDRSIFSYVKTRDATPLYQEVVNATIRGDFYNGSQYTLVGFGFILPATNNKNVLYRDMKLPVPFHLAIRLIVRFQESRLLLPEESRQILVCLAMALYNISFYRCRPASGK